MSESSLTWTFDVHLFQSALGKNNLALMPHGPEVFVKKRYSQQVRPFWGNSYHRWLVFMLRPSDLNLHSMFWLAPLTNLNFTVFVMWQVTPELQGTDPIKEIVVKIAAKIATFVNAKLKLISFFHTDEAVPLCFNDRSDHLLSYILTDYRHVSLSFP